jgi:putative membrane protein
MITDLVLAILHHFLVFMLVGALVAEAFFVRPGLSGANLATVGRLDAMYGGLSGAIILVGIGRVFFGLKGWEYYVYYWAFWAKMAAFLVVGLLSILPTRRIMAWRKAAAGNAAYAVPDGEIAGARAYIRGEAIFLALVIIFAAVMARGVGY